MKSNSHQTGLTLISWLILLALIGFVVWFGAKIFPIYMEYYSVNSVMNTATQRVQLNETPQQIRLSIDNMFTINGVDDVSPKDNVTIHPAQDNSNVTILTLDYESRTNFIGNIDLILHFHRVYQATPH